MTYRILAISGQSGSGKTLIENKLIEEIKEIKGLKVRKIPQVTTRQPRTSEELNSGTYSFISELEFSVYADEYGLIAETEVNGFRYGTFNDLQEDVINTVIVDRMGYNALIKDIEKLYPHNFLIEHVQVTNDDPEIRTDGRDSSRERELLDGVTNHFVNNSRHNWGRVVQDLVEIIEDTVLIDI